MAKKVRAVAIGLGAIFLAGGVAYASIPAGDGTIKGCYKNNGGDLRVIDSAASCPSGYTPLNWNQTGPQGPVGPAGTDGVSGREYTDTTFTIPAGENFSHRVTCPGATTQVVTGGYAIDPGGIIESSRPTDREWIVNGTNPTSQPRQLFINVFCATFS